MTVAAKTLWSPWHVHGSLWGFWPSDLVYMGGMNFAFFDGHAQTFAVQPRVDHWLATGGSPYPPQTPAGYGFSTYTYPPGQEAAASFAQWWAVPWYPDGPLGQSAIANWYPAR